MPPVFSNVTHAQSGTHLSYNKRPNLYSALHSNPSCSISIRALRGDEQAIVSAQLQTAKVIANQFIEVDINLDNCCFRSC